MLISVSVSELTSYTNINLFLDVLIVIALKISISNILPNNILNNNFINLNNTLNTFLYNNIFNKFLVYILNTKDSKQDNIFHIKYNMR